VKKYLFLLLVVVLALYGCNAQGASASLIGTWILTAYGSSASSSPAVPDSGAEITFNEDETVIGNSGCNGFGGKYTVKGDQITFSEIVSTLMACDAARMTQEAAVHRVLSDTATFKIEGAILTLTNNDMALVLTRVSYP
jgi:heat shock protein HslJ